MYILLPSNSKLHAKDFGNFILYGARVYIGQCQIGGQSIHKSYMSGCMDHVFIVTAGRERMYKGCESSENLSGQFV